MSSSPSSLLRRVARLLLLVSAGALTAPAYASDYLMTVSGPFQSFINDSAAFDGADTTTLPPLFNIPALTGGSFRATFRFRDTPTPPSSGQFASYSFAEPAGMTYELLNATGQVIHAGTSPSFSGASVLNDGTPPSGTTDSVSLYGFVNQVSGLNIPQPIYTPSGGLESVQSSLGFSGLVTPVADYLSGLAVPTTTSVYQSFPNAKFFTGMLFLNGDTDTFVDPYQYVETDLIYSISSVSVSVVPAPGAFGMLALAGLLAARRQRAA